MVFLKISVAVLHLTTLKFHCGKLHHYTIYFRSTSSDIKHSSNMFLNANTKNWQRN